MSEALERILGYASAFSEWIARCRTATFNAPDVQDAYNRLSRLRDRYLHEKRNRTLDTVEEQALRKVFEADRFIEGMLDGRQISEHVQKTSGDDTVILLTTSSRIPLCVKTSTGSFFAVSTATVRDTTGMVYSVNHLAQLSEAEKRIQRALERAQKT
jgi:hypothetical protein